MTSIKVILRDKATKEGMYPVVLRIIKDRKSKLISLGFECLKKDWDEENNQFKKSHQNHIQRNRLLLKYKDKALKIIDDFLMDEIDFTLNQFEEKFRGTEPNKITVLEFWDEVISDLIKSGKAGNAKALSETKKSLFSFYKKTSLMFKEITPAFLEKYEVYLRENNNSDGGVAFKMRELRSLYNRAMKKNVVEEKYYPFKVYKVSKLKVGNIKKALTREEVRLIENLDDLKHPNLVDAKRIFLFSYYCRGMNYFDIMMLKWSNVFSSRINYIRSKTKGRFSIEILQPVQQILEFYRKMPATTDYVFPILLKENMTATQIQNRKHKKLKKFNSDLKKIAEIVGIDKPLSSYVARHSYATNLKQLGVSTDVVSQSMGHKNVAITTAYLKDFEDDVIDRENEKLLQESLSSYNENQSRLAS